MRHFKVQVWIYREAKGGGLEVLLLLLKPERGGFWQPVTGGVDPGEALEAAALREATEETGLSFEGVPESLDYSFRFTTPRFGGAECEEHVYALRAPSVGNVRIDPHEHVDWHWVAAADAAAQLKHASNAEGLRRLMTR